MKWVLSSFSCSRQLSPLVNAPRGKGHHHVYLCMCGLRALGPAPSPNTECSIWHVPSDELPQQSPVEPRPVSTISWPPRGSMRRCALNNWSYLYIVALQKCKLLGPPSLQPPLRTW